MTNESEQKKNETRWIQLVAGTDSQGAPVLEKLEVKLTEVGAFEMLRSPLFVRDLAAGDIFSCAPDNPADYQIMKRSGNLAIRFFRKDNVAPLVWYYGNIYDRHDGVTPLHWWDEFLNTV